MLRYQAGRMLTYAFAGSVAGQLGALIDASWLVSTSPLLLSLGAAAALLILAARLWRPAARTRPVQLTTAPRGRSTLGRLLALLPREPAVYGGLSVLLPCGALAAALLLGAASGDRLHGALLMASFATTSGLGVIAGGALLSRLTAIANRRLARGLALALTVAAIAVSVPALSRAATGAEPQQPAPSCH